MHMPGEACLALVATPSRLVLLSRNDVTDSALEQSFQDNTHLRLTRSHTLRPSMNDAELVLVDVASFADAECLQLLRQLRDTPAALVNVPVDQARRLLELHTWIRGVFYPNASRSHISRGIGIMLGGGDWLPRALMEKLLGRYRQLTHASRVIDELSVREKQILALAGKGLSNAEIAERLHLSTHTIKSHIHNALGKLGASNRAQGASLVLAHVSEAGL